MIVIISILCLISIWLNFKSLIACMTSDLVGASWRELFKIGINIVILIYLYGQTTTNI